MCAIPSTLRIGLYHHVIRTRLREREIEPAVVVNLFPYTYYKKIVHVGSVHTKYDIKNSFKKYTGWPKKLSHYRESSLNRIKNRQPD